MRAWRLARRAHSALDGEGARRAGGRWNSPGLPLVYASSHLSLAALELLVHLDPDEVPADLAAFLIDIPDTVAVERIEPAALPPRWRVEEENCRRAGDAWLRARRTAVLIVPSALIPEELNTLLNPTHADAGRVRVVSSRPFTFDPRLF